MNAPWAPQCACLPPADEPVPTTLAGLDPAIAVGRTPTVTMPEHLRGTIAPAGGPLEREGPSHVELEDAEVGADGSFVLTMREA